MNYLSLPTDFFISLVFQYRYLLLFPITIVEGPLVTMASGFLVSLSIMNPIVALPIIIAGDVTGDILYYCLGRFGEKWSLTRAAIRRFKLESIKERINHSFESHGGKILLFGKLTHAIGIVFLIGAGYSRMNLSRFISYNLVGTFIKSSILLYVGYLAGSAYKYYEKYFEYGALFISILSIIIIALFLYFSHYIFNCTAGIELEKKPKNDTYKDK